MKTTNINNVGYWIQKYLLEYLPTIRNLSRNTILSYRDALQQLIEYMSLNGYKIDKLSINDITVEVIMGFLKNLEQLKKCSVLTRNQRLAAISSFGKYIAVNAPEYLHWFQSIKAIPLKKSDTNVNKDNPMPKIQYLEKDEMNELLAAPDRNTVQGRRDYILLLFMYNTGARASEVANLKIGHVKIESASKISQVLISGKGRKIRICPLWDNTARNIVQYLKRNDDEFVFLNRYGNPMTRFGIYEMVTRYAKKISAKNPFIKKKIVTPHTIRHTTASHLLEAGVDINTIKAWLGHVSVNTTSIYAEVNIRMKASALKTCEIDEKEQKKLWKNDSKLLEVLKSIR